jgi:hypothetical protein
VLCAYPKWKEGIIINQVNAKAADGKQTAATDMIR